MASSIGAGRARMVLWTLFAAALFVAVIDGGSVALARMQVSDDAQGAAREAAQAVAGQPINPTTAQVAYDAGLMALPNDRERIVKNGPGDAQDFRVGADGSVTLTVTREAPTLVFKHLPPLRDWTHASSTYTQTKIGF